MEDITRIPRGGLMAVLLLAAGPASAQQAREANIWNGRDHEPNPAEVQAQEKSAGVAPDNQQVRQEDEQLQRMARQLLQQAGQPAHQ
jgi:small-conductance mechanosensitive channel